MERPGQCFLSYSHHDHDGFERLLAHVKPLESLYGFTIFHDRRLTAGSHWNDRIKAEVEKSNIYVALVTTDFLASDYILQHELPAMLHRYGARKALFVPVIYRDCGWEGFFGDYIQATPLDAKYRLLPVCDWPRPEKALATAGKALGKSIEDWFGVEKRPFLSSTAVRIGGPP